MFSLLCLYVTILSMNSNVCAVRNNKSNTRKHSPIIRRRSPSLSPQFPVPWHSRGSSNFDLSGFCDPARLLHEQEKQSELLKQQRQEGQRLAEQLVSLQAIIDQQKIALDIHHEELQNRHDRIDMRINGLESLHLEGLHEEQNGHKLILCDLIDHTHVTTSKMNEIHNNLNIVAVRQREIADSIGRYREQMKQLLVDGNNYVKQQKKKQDSIEQKVGCISRDLDKHDREEVETRLAGSMRIARLERVYGGLVNKIEVLKEGKSQEARPEELSMVEIERAQANRAEADRLAYENCASEHSGFVSNLLQDQKITPGI